MADAAAERAPGLVSRMTTFYHDVMNEMRRVSWPTRPEVQQATISIIAIVLFVGAVIAVLDVVIQQVLVVGLPRLFGGR